MNEFINKISDNNLELVCILIAVVAIILAIIVIIDVVLKRKKTAPLNVIEEKENVEKISTEISQPDIKQEEIKEEINELFDTKERKTIEIDEIKYVEENEELEKTKAQLQLQTLKEELIKLENDGKQNIEEIKVEKDPIVEIKEIKQDEKDLPILNYSSDEEENAIISIEELKKASMNAFSDAEMSHYKDEGNEPISIQEVEELQKTMELKPIEMKDFNNIDEEKATSTVSNIANIEEDKKFHKTPYISPVYGIKETEDSISLEQTANLDKLNDEIRKTTEFLAALKELRKNLE